MRLLFRLDRYIVRKFITTFLFVLGLLLLIIVVIDVAERMGDFIDQQTPVNGLALVYYPNYLLYLGNLLSPVVVFVAVIFFTANMTQKSEVVAILASGTSFYRLLRPYIAVALLMVAISFYMNAYLVPKASQRFQQFDENFIKSEQAPQGKNLHKKLGPNSYLYVRNFNEVTASGFKASIEETDPADHKRILRIIDANTIQWLPEENKWRLQRLQIREFGPDGHTLSSQFTLDTALALLPRDLSLSTEDAKEFTLTELSRYIELERSRGSTAIESLERERHQRFAFPMATLILTVMGVALSTRKRRGGIGLQLGLGLMFSFIYIALLQIAQVALADNFPPWLAIWLPNIIFLVLAVFLIRIAPK